MPEVSEGEIVRYFSQISQMNFSIDHNFYPLGSCTMKYNPKLNDEIASLPGFAEVHPLQSEETAQGAIRLLWELQELLNEITGMAGCSLAPMAGADGELGRDADGPRVPHRAWASRSVERCLYRTPPTAPIRRRRPWLGSRL